MPDDPSFFALPEHLSPKSDPALIAADEAHFAAIAGSLARSVADLEQRLATERTAAGGTGRAVLDRDLEIHRLTSRLRTLKRYGVDLCLGRVVTTAGRTTYIGRLGLTDPAGERLLVDWRSPAAAPFFAATHADPMDLASRRRYRWTDGRIGDYWDEVFTAAGLDGNAALDDQSAFIASLGATRSPRMRDVLGTIAADQDAIIRAGSDGTLVVDGGPGTGKTVVALHRAAYLLYSDPRVSHRHGGVLFIGPHQPYLDYVADVLPSLGEDGVQTCTLHDLVPEALTAVPETDPDVARLKESVDVIGVIGAAVSFYEDPPTTTTTIETEWDEVHLHPADWRQAFEAVEPDTPHNEAREQILAELVAILTDLHDDEVPTGQLEKALRRNGNLVGTLNRAWPILQPADVVADLWSVPAYLRRCAPGLSADEVRLLQRSDPTKWTEPDLPLLDAARHRLGDPDAAERDRRAEAVRAAEREEMDRVVEHLIETDDSEEAVMSMLRGADLQAALVQDDNARTPDALAGPFAHVVVDEAQELTDAQWQMLLLRCPSRSFTVVGDRAQARHGFTETWSERLERVGLNRIRQASLSINYRTPEEVMAAAEPQIRAVLPNANVPTSIRSSGIPVTVGSTNDLDEVVAGWLAAHAEGEGIACVIGYPSFRPRPRVRSLTPALAKGLEFDLVVVVDPDRFGAGIEGAVDRYVAMTRATRELVILRPDGPRPGTSTTRT